MGIAISLRLHQVQSNPNFCMGVIMSLLQDPKPSPALSPDQSPWLCFFENLGPSPALSGRGIATARGPSNDIPKLIDATNGGHYQIVMPEVQT
jgi:hypothetical protein